MIYVDILRVSNDLDVVAEKVEGNSYLATRIGGSGQGIVLEANEEGLIVLASALLGLAARMAKGAHLHFDVNSYLDEAECSFIVVKT